MQIDFLYSWFFSGYISSFECEICRNISSSSFLLTLSRQSIIIASFLIRTTSHSISIHHAITWKDQWSRIAGFAKLVLSSIKSFSSTSYKFDYNDGVEMKSQQCLIASKCQRLYDFASELQFMTRISIKY